MDEQSASSKQDRPSGDSASGGAGDEKTEDLMGIIRENAIQFVEVLKCTKDIFTGKVHQNGDGTGDAGHPYRKLSGLLWFVVYGNYVAAALGAVWSVSSNIGLLLLARYLGVSMTLSLVLALVSEIAFCFTCVLWATMIRKKDSRFLQFYHSSAVVYVLLMAVCAILGGMPSYLSSAVYLAVYTAAWTVYFAKSVRVRTYMGSDEYLRRSPFTKNLEAPQPADA